MRLLHFSINLLNKEKNSSLLYIVYLILSIMAINIVTNLYLNPNYILENNQALIWKDGNAIKVDLGDEALVLEDTDILIEGNMVFFASPVTIFIAVFCIVLLAANAHNYFLYDKHQMMGIMKLSGCGHKQILIYLITQTFTLLLVAIPFGIILGNLGFEVFHYIFCKIIGIPYHFGNSSFTACIYTIIILVVLIFYLAIITVGFVSRYEIKELVMYKDAINREQIEHKMLNFDIPGIIPLAIVVILFFVIFSNYKQLDLMAGYSIFSYGFFIGSIINKCLVSFINWLKKKRYINNKIMIATLSFVNLNIVRLNPLIRLLGVTVTCAFYYMVRYYIYKIDFMYFYLMFLIYATLAIFAILYQMIMESKTRVSTLKQLGALGYTKRDVFRIIKKEITITITIVGSIGFMYGGLILHSSFINNLIVSNIIVQYIVIYISLLVIVGIVAYTNYKNLISREVDEDD